jgi:hypothetical protein
LRPCRPLNPRTTLWVNDMPADDRQREYRREMLLASMLIAAGLAAQRSRMTASRTRSHANGAGDAARRNRRRR